MNQTPSQSHMKEHIKFILNLTKLLTVTIAAILCHTQMWTRLQWYNRNGLNKSLLTLFIYKLWHE
jgi:hypothetical protein